MQSATVTTMPVQNVAHDPHADGPVGYMLFNDHMLTAEQQLIDAFTTLRRAERHRSGARPALQRRRLARDRERGRLHDRGQRADGRVRTFERLEFNDKHTVDRSRSRAAR